MAQGDGETLEEMKPQELFILEWVPPSTASKPTFLKFIFANPLALFTLGVPYKQGGLCS